MIQCPKCEKPLDVYYEPTTDSWTTDGVVAFPAQCSDCGWKGEVCFDVVFRNYYDAETEETIEA